MQDAPHPGRSPESNSSAAAQLHRRVRWEALALSAIALAVVGAGILGLWMTSVSTIRDNYHHYLIGLAQTAASLIDPQLQSTIRRADQLNGPAYERAVAPLRRMQAAVPDVHFIYTIAQDHGTVHFVLDASPPHVDENGLNSQSGVWEVYEERDPAMLLALGTGTRAGTAAATEVPFSDKWGTFMTGWAPLRDASGAQIGAVGIDVDSSVYAARVSAAPRWALLGLSPALILIAVLGTAYYRIRLRSLSDAQEALDGRLSLKSSESKFRSLFELSPVGIALNDLRDGRFLNVNDALLGPSGYSREDLLQMTLHDVVTANAADQTPWSVDSNGRHGPSEVEFVRKDGGRYPVLLAGFRMTDSAGYAVIWSIVQDISQRKAMESELATAARQDKLTGLANRASFMEHLQRAIERVRADQQQLCAVLFLDFDRFKFTNDTLGHRAGDELLRQIASRLRGSLRDADVVGADFPGNLVGRFGGDEFLILVNDLQAPGNATLVAERLLSALSATYDIFGNEVQSTASIGIGIVTGELCQISAEDIVRNADIAMYAAKRSGGGCAVVFNDAMQIRVTRHVAIETSMRKAIGSSEMYLVYQPIVDLESGCMVSAEALLRWNHPIMGPIAPSEFIPIAEESNIIIAIGEWVVREACTAMVEWRRVDPQRAPKTIGVNISRAELALGARLPDRLRATLDSVGLPSECLQLEVTEREVMRDPEASLGLMQDLRRLGVRLAMDDFGTGTSSLGILRDYPFDTIKIDRSFVVDLISSQDVLAVTHATIALIENLGMVSLAEGVEDASQVAVLQSLGCSRAQGYYFSRPVRAERLLDALEPRFGRETESS